MSPEQLQDMINQLNNLKTSKTSPAPAPAAPAPAAAPDSPPVSRIDTSMPPHFPHDVPPSARQPHMHYAYPPYGYYSRPGPPSHAGEAPHPPAPAPPPKAAPSPAPPAPSKTPAPMPGSFGAPEAPAPPPPSKTPAPLGRPEPARKPSEQASEISYASSKSHDMAHAWEQWGGQLVEVAPGREPRPKPKLVSLFKGIAGYMIALLEPTNSCVVTLDKLMQFYMTFPAGPEEEKHDQDYWLRFFNTRNPRVLSELFCALNVEHHLVPTKTSLVPTVPGLTPRGFEVWMFTQLMTAPHREWIRLSKVLDQWTLFDQGRVEMPKLIPRECFPPTEDRQIFTGWWQAVQEDFPADDSVASDDEHKVPLGLPAPEKPAPGRRRRYSIRDGDIAHEAPATEDDPKDSPPAATPSLTRKRTNRPYSVSKPYPPTSAVPDPHEFLTPEEKSGSPEQPRFPHPYGDPATPAPAPSWREDGRREEINPRPTLGEEPPRPPNRSRSVKPKGPSTTTTTTKEPTGSSRRPATATTTKRGRSTHRRRGESPERYSDEEDYDQGKYDSYSKRYEGDGLYEDPSPPTRTTTPHHPSYHTHREPSRGPSSRKADKDIRDYTYQEQYEKDYAPTVSATSRRHRGSDAHLPSSSRKGQWRYA